MGSKTRKLNEHKRKPAKCLSYHTQPLPPPDPREILLQVEENAFVPFWVSVRFFFLSRCNGLWGAYCSRRPLTQRAFFQLKCSFSLHRFFLPPLYIYIYISCIRHVFSHYNVMRNTIDHRTVRALFNRYMYVRKRTEHSLIQVIVGGMDECHSAAVTSHYPVACGDAD